MPENLDVLEFAEEGFDVFLVVNGKIKFLIWLEGN